MGLLSGITEKKQHSWSLLFVILPIQAVLFLCCSLIFAVFLNFLLIACFRVPQQEVENFKKLNVISQDEFETLAPKMPVDQNQEVPPLPIPGGFNETAVTSVLHQPSSFLFAAFCILFLFYCSWIDTVDSFSSETCPYSFIELYTRYQKKMGRPG